MSERLKTVSVKREYISIFICWMAYVSVYFSRYAYSANIGVIENEYRVSHAEAGLVMTFFSIAYGAGQLFHGILCRHYPRRYIVSVSLLVAGTINLIIFFNLIPFKAIKYLWLINAVSQSVLWPMLLQIISENVGARLMKKAILVMSTTTSFGTLCIYGLSAAFAEINFRLTFLIGAAILFVCSAVWFILYKPGGYIRMNFKKSTAQNDKKSRIGIIVLPIALLTVFSIVTNFLKDGLQTWVPVILKHIKPNLPDSFSILLTLVLPLFGIFGATAAVFVNKKIKKAIPLCLFFFCFTALFNFIVLEFRNSLVITVVSFGVLELLLHGSANIIVSIFPLSMRDKMSSGALAGILNGSAYVGSAASSYLLGSIADRSGWTTVFITLLGAVCSALILGAVYLVLSVKKPEINP